MSVWKKLNKQDSFVTSYVAKKRWTLSGNDLESAGVRLLPAYSNLRPQEVILDRDKLCVSEFNAEQLGDTCLLLNLSGSVLPTCHMELQALPVLV
jgi:hypothetical protein